MEEKYKDKAWLYEEYVVKRRSMSDISREFNKIGCSIVGYYLNKFGIAKRSRSEILYELRKNPSINMTKELNEFLVGNVLGDGGIHGRPSLHMRTASYVHSSKYYDMLSYISEYLNEFGIELMGSIRKYVHPQNKATYYTFWSRNYSEFFELRNKLYKDKKKIVPNELELTPTICLHWYIGDGSLTKRNIGNPYIRICTQGFSKEDVFLLRDKLVGLGFKVERTESGNSLRFSSYSTNDFLSYIGECPEPIKHIYGYKFNTQEK